MIPFQKVDPPTDFEEKAGRPGSTWLEEHPAAKRPKDFWSPFKKDLAEGFGQLCAYSAIYEPVGTVDHFVSWNEDKTKAYTWSNYRFSSGWLNSSKQSVRSEQILDPFEIGENWFEILLPSLQLVVADQAPLEYRARCEFVLDKFHLQDDERVLRSRREWYRMYQYGELTLEGLQKKAPLIAAAVKKSQI